jgi:hypothetical protein
LLSADWPSGPSTWSTSPVTCIPSRQPQNDLGIGCLRAWAKPFPEASELRGGQCGAPRPKRPLRLPRRITSSAWSRLSLRHCPQLPPITSQDRHPATVWLGVGVRSISLSLGCNGRSLSRGQVKRLRV